MSDKSNLFFEGDEDLTSEDNLTPTEGDEIQDADSGETTDDSYEEDENENTEDAEDIDEEEEEAPQPKPTPDENTKAWKKRIERAKRSIERDLLEEVNSLSDGVTISREEIPQATRLWNFIKANPELNSVLKTSIDSLAKEGKITDLKTYSKNPLHSDGGKKTEDRLNLYEAKLDLKFSDPIYKKYEDKILEWAEDNDFPIKSKRSLQIAYKAWKGENAESLMQKAEMKGRETKQEKRIKQKEAKLVGKTRTSVRTKPVDYRKAEDKDILRSEGLSLFSDD